MSFPASYNDNHRKSDSCSKLLSNAIISAFLCQHSFGYTLNSRVIFSFHKHGNSLKMETCLNELSLFNTVL